MRLFLRKGTVVTSVVLLESGSCISNQDVTFYISICLFIEIGSRIAQDILAKVA